MNLRYLIQSAFLTAVSAGCGGSSPANDAGTPTFQQIQSQVFVSCSFSSCHSGTNPQAGMSLASGVAYEAIVGHPSTEVPTRTRVVPGDPDGSFLMDKLLGRNLPASPSGETWTAMPPPNVGGMLESSRLELVRAWILDGAKP